MKKKLLTLAKEYDFENAEDYYYYIVESKVNGNQDQVRKLFNNMQKIDKENFLNNFLKVGDLHDEEVKAICIEELLK